MKHFGKLRSTIETISIVTPEVTMEIPETRDENGVITSPAQRIVISPERTSNVLIMVLRNADGVEWHDLFKQYPHPWYIAVQDDGTIISMESDPEQSQIPDVSIWGIDETFGFTRGTGGTVYGKRWNGATIVSAPVTPLGLALDPDQFYSLLDGLGKIDQFMGGIETVTPTAKKLTCRNQFNNSTMFTWDMVLMALVAPKVWGDAWQDDLSSAWIAAAV
ncbi:hypothetical protein [Phyllobacterium sp. OV277]|uniref:hypothetical protein n=1 Tax=Phyllobacterium sp. OV277 TaxID=1882772 RepID=UPI0008843599|nr:hypothetical protein [Phyllobacterium sp. OV277]SDP08154.1 hypothetical protein SAMN05443582_103351 [Phyllobacterium sp. OV277]